MRCFETLVSFIPHSMQVQHINCKGCLLDPLNSLSDLCEYFVNCLTPEIVLGYCLF